MTRRVGILCQMTVDIGLSVTFTPSKPDEVDVKEGGRWMENGRWRMKDGGWRMENEKEKR